MARVLRKKPTTPSVSRRSRLAAGTPTTTSSCPLMRPRYAANAPSSVMNSEAPALRASSSSRRPSGAASVKDFVLPRNDCSRGRGRSAGRVRQGGAAASALRQKARLSSSWPVDRRPCCQAAQSA